MNARFSPDGKMIASGRFRRGRQDLGCRDGREIRALRAIVVASITPYSAPMAERSRQTSDDGSAKIWDLDTGEELLALRGHRGIFQPAAFSHRRPHLSSRPDSMVP